MTQCTTTSSTDNCEDCECYTLFRAELTDCNIIKNFGLALLGLYWLYCSRSHGTETSLIEERRMRVFVARESYELSI